MMTMMIMTGISSGKRFEHNWKNSIPKDVFYYRLRDGSSSWGGNENVRFQVQNICDSIMFDGDYLYTLELKSTKGKSLPFNNIKKHQIDDLLWCSSYQNVIAGFVIEFSELSECYFVEINQFNAFYDKTNRKSLPLKFCQEKGIKISAEKKKINSRFDIEKFLNDVKGK